MGRSLRAKLVYGYDLGGDESGWKFPEVDEDGCISLPWFDEDDKDNGFVEQAQRRLLAEIAGFTETWGARADDYHKRLKAAEKRLGVTFEWYGVSDYSEQLLAAHVVNVDYCKAVDLVELATHPDRETWDAALAAAIAALGITPEQDQPGWFSCAYYG